MLHAVTLVVKDAYALHQRFERHDTASPRPQYRMPRIREEANMAGPSAKLLALCTIAVGAIYASGYVATEPSAQGGGTPSTNVSTPRTRQHTQHPKSQGNSEPQSQSSPTSGSSAVSPSASSTQSPTPKKSPYKDGHYTGSGSNPYGTLSVSVTIAQGKIAAVNITSYVMHFPQAYIDPQINNEVVSMQTWRVYAVSGATASSDNFAEAVYFALQKARA